jgi:hypothetical protein
MNATDQRSREPGVRPTIVLVHGAFADASSWNGVIERLHSYAGAVITTAATSAPNVVGLVYIAAFATEEGENLNDVESGSKDSILGPALVQYKYPAGPDGETAVELAVNPALFREAFAADLPPETTALMAATQRPTALTAFSEASGPP